MTQMIDFTDYETFFDVLHDDAVVVKFASKTDEITYKQIDARLIERIKEVYARSKITEGVHLHSKTTVAQSPPSRRV